MSVSTFFLCLLRTVPALFPGSNGQIFGHWEKTCNGPSTAKRGMNIGKAFRGEKDVNLALRKSARRYRSLHREKCISIGGGNNRKRSTKHTLRQINKGIRNGIFRRYSGIAFDVELGDSGLSKISHIQYSTSSLPRVVDLKH